MGVLDSYRRCWPRASGLDRAGVLATLALGGTEAQQVPGEEPQPAKTLWDWLQLLVIPLALAGLAFLLDSSQTNRELQREDERAARQRMIATDAGREDALRAYLTQMSALMLDRKLLQSEEDSTVRALARTITLTTLSRVDGERKGVVLQFLSEARLLFSANPPPGPKVNLQDANLRSADLRDADLQYAYLALADLQGALLQRALLYNATLFLADLRGADLRGADPGGRTFCTRTSGGRTSGGRTSRGRNFEQRTSGGRTSRALTGGRTSATRTSRGRTSERRTSGEQTFEGPTSKTRTSGGRTSGGQTSGGRTSGQTSGGRTSRGRISERRTFRGRTSGGRTSGSRASGGQRLGGRLRLQDSLAPGLRPRCGRS